MTSRNEIRTSLDEVVARNPNIQISAKVASNHGAILKKDFPAVAEAVREVAALDHGALKTRPVDRRHRLATIVVTVELHRVRVARGPQSFARDAVKL